MPTINFHSQSGVEVMPGNHHIRIEAVDRPGPGGAYHHYQVSIGAGETPIEYHLHFQKGGLQEAGPNGLTNEVLLAVVLHRLACFQTGQFRSNWNQIAMDAVENALKMLHQRTRDRVNRGVEGKQEP